MFKINHTQAPDIMDSGSFSVVRFTDLVSHSLLAPSDKLLGYVRLKARVVGEVEVLFRQTLSGL